MKQDTIKALKEISKKKCCNRDCNEKATSLSKTVPYCERCYNKIKKRKKVFRLPRSPIYSSYWERRR